METLIKSKMLFDIQPVQMQSGLTPGLPEVVKYSVKCFSSTLLHPFLQREGVKPASEVGRLSTLSACSLTKEGRSTINLSRKVVSHMYAAQLGWKTTGLWVAQIRLRLLIQRPYLTWLNIDYWEAIGFGVLLALIPHKYACSGVFKSVS